MARSLSGRGACGPYGDRHAASNPLRTVENQLRANFLLCRVHSARAAFQDKPRRPRSTAAKVCPDSPSEISKS